MQSIKRDFLNLCHLGAPPEPLNVTVSDKKSNQLSVQWLPPEETIAFGIYGYIVQHWRFATKDVFAKHVKAPEGKSEFSYQIENLEPDTSYVIRVAAKNNYGKNFNEGTAYQTLPARKLPVSSIFELFSSFSKHFSFHF